MSFKPYCEMCNSWHTEQEGHLVEPLITTCPGCGQPVTSYWMKDNTGCVRGDYDLITDTVWHKPCWDKLVAKYPPEEVGE